MKKPDFNSYDSCLNYLFNLERAGIKYDLSNIRSLLTILGNPERSFHSVHVAGTNGKGSVSSMIYSYMIESGMRAGLYTSPHILDFRERIICGRQMISRQYVMRFVKKMYKHAEEIGPSFFEVTTAMAFDYFREKKVDIAVIETGLGGRLDSTNVIDPVISVITGISVDHVEYLGSTIKGIAKEKAGIIKKGRPVITGKLSGEAKKVIQQAAVSRNSEFFNSWHTVKADILHRSERGIDAVIEGMKVFINGIGDFQIINAKTAFAALKIFCRERGIDFDFGKFSNALKNIPANARLHGRFELISKAPKIVVDVSHNLEAMKNLRSNIRYFSFERLVVMLGMMHDKDYCSCIRELAKQNCEVILTRPAYSRAADPQVMLNCISSGRKKFNAFGELKDAVRHALLVTGKRDLLVVTGSFFLAGEFLQLFKALNSKKSNPAE